MRNHTDGTTESKSHDTRVLYKWQWLLHRELYVCRPASIEKYDLFTLILDKLDRFTELTKKELNRM